MSISQERATMIARSHHCLRCQEYSYKRVVVKEASEALREALHEAWHATLVCGVCGLQQELGIAGDGDVLYVT